MTSRFGHISLAALLLVAACGGRQVPVNTQQTQYLQTNVRAHGNVVTSVNEWEKQTVLEVCTPVRLQWARGREIRFLVDGKAYRYIVYRGSRLPLEEHLARTFGPTCPVDDSLPPIDRAGIREARPYEGMTKQGVIMAVGHPPDHKTSSLQQPTWTYWGKRGRVQIHFEGDVVSQIEGADDEPAVMSSEPPAAALAGGGEPPAPPTAGGEAPAAYGGSASGTGTGSPSGAGTGSPGDPGASPDQPQGAARDAVGRLCKAGDPCPQGLRCVEDERDVGHCRPVN